MSYPLCESVVVIDIQIMTTNEQLELGFNAATPRIFGQRREQRVARAKWWFAAPRAEQIWMPGANREIQV